jgi:predicted PurR-regulated permease PerM
VFTAGTVLALIVWWNVRELTTIVISALLLAYALDPLIRRVQAKTRLRRSYATVVVYLVFALALSAAAAALAPTLARGLMSLDPNQWQTASAQMIARLPSTIRILDRQHDLAPLYAALQQQARTLELTFVGRESLVWLLGFATDFAFTVLGVFFTLVLSVYLAMDTDNIMAWVEKRIPEPYRASYNAVRLEIGDVWQSFFRGQMVLVVVIAVATTLGLMALGVPYALWLGLIAGSLEVVPRVGPTLSVVPAVVVSATQPSTSFPGLPRLWFVLAVVALYIVIQQLENNILVPRIIGARVKLPAAVVLAGALAGASLAGIIGILLAPPIIGSLRVLGSWLYFKVAGDVTPLEEPELQLVRAPSIDRPAPESAVTDIPKATMDFRGADADPPAEASGLSCTAARAAATPRLCPSGRGLPPLPGPATSL